MAVVLDALGYNRSDRKYHVLWDGYNGSIRGGAACGIANAYINALDSSTPYASSNQGFPTLGARTDSDVGNVLSDATGLYRAFGQGSGVSRYSITFNHVFGPQGPSCFFNHGLSTVSTQTHEILHTLGAVQTNAPNYDKTGRGGSAGHCSDAPSILCSGGAQGYGLGSSIRACARVLVETLDCGMDDYWSPNPKVDSYLGTHYNVAASPFFGPQPQDSLVASPL